MVADSVQAIAVDPQAAAVGAGVVAGVALGVATADDEENEWDDLEENDSMDDGEGSDPGSYYDDSD